MEKENGREIETETETEKANEKRKKSDVFFSACCGGCGDGDGEDPSLRRRLRDCESVSRASESKNAVSGAVGRCGGHDDGDGERPC